MASQLDFVGYRADGSLALVVEAKARTGTSSSWATEFREYLLANNALSRDVMFALATPRAFYLWQAGADPEARPTYEVHGEELFRPYLARAGLSKKSNLDPIVFEMVVAAWLRDVAAGQIEHNDVLEAYRVLKGGQVVASQAA